MKPAVILVRDTMMLHITSTMPLKRPPLSHLDKASKLVKKPEKEKA